MLGALLASDNAYLRLTGLIAIDVALFEKFESQPYAERALAAALAKPGENDPMLLLKLADMNRSPALVAPLQAMIALPDLPTDTAVHAILLLRTFGARGARTTWAIRPE